MNNFFVQRKYGQSCGLNIKIVRSPGLRRSHHRVHRTAGTEWYINQTGLYIQVSLCYCKYIIFSTFCDAGIEYCCFYSYFPSTISYSRKVYNTWSSTLYAQCLYDHAQCSFIFLLALYIILHEVSDQCIVRLTVCDLRNRFSVLQLLFWLYEHSIHYIWRKHFCRYIRYNAFLQGSIPADTERIASIRITRF